MTHSERTRVGLALKLLADTIAARRKRHPRTSTDYREWTEELRKVEDLRSLLPLLNENTQEAVP